VKEEKTPQYPSLSWVRGRHKRKAITNPNSIPEEKEIVDQVCTGCKIPLKKLKWETGSRGYILVCDNIYCSRFREPQEVEGSNPIPRRRGWLQKGV